MAVRLFYALLILSYLMFAHGAFAQDNTEDLRPVFSVISKNGSLDKLPEMQIDSLKQIKTKGMMFIMHAQGALKIEEQEFDPHSILQMMN